MTSRPAVPESETPETDALVKRSPKDIMWAQYVADIIELARSLERRLSQAHEALVIATNAQEDAERREALAQTEIKGHMRIEDDLKRALEEMTISNRYHAEDSLKHLHRAEAAEGRIAELEKDAARYRWLRLHAKDRNVWQPINAPEMFDAAIDAALKDRA